MGHPNDIFLSEPDNTLICAICHEVQSDASSFRECGHTFCDECISECLATNPTCPTCRTPVDTGSNPNYSLRDIIDKLEVKCPEYEKGDMPPPSKRFKTTGENNEDDGADNITEPAGCGWRGTVGDLQKHMVDECVLTTIACGEEGCTYTCQRRDMEAHKSSQQGMMMHMELRYDNKLKAIEMKYESKYQMMSDSIIELQREANLCFNKQCILPERKIKRGVMYCTRCGVANYCSRNCQTRDWRNHQAYCDRHVGGRIASQNGSGARPLANGSVNPPSERAGHNTFVDDDDGIDWSAAVMGGGIEAAMRDGDDGGGVTSSNHFYGSALNDAIIRVVRRTQVPLPDGLHINSIILELQCQGFSGRDVSSAVRLLADEGHLYSTIDENHFHYAE